VQEQRCLPREGSGNLVVFNLFFFLTASLGWISYGNQIAEGDKHGQKIPVGTYYITGYQYVICRQKGAGDR
jgi:hypothetical protein